MMPSNVRILVRKSAGTSVKPLKNTPNVAVTNGPRIRPPTTAATIARLSTLNHLAMKNGVANIHRSYRMENNSNSEQ